MATDLWQGKIDAYVDAELSADEMRAFDAHLRECASCTSDLLGRMQLKRAVHVAGKRYAPSPELRLRVEAALPKKKKPVWFWGWAPRMAAAAAIVLIGVLVLYRWSASQQERTIAEIADLHVANLASSSPVDVVSTDRHTVKPWFQGKLPFTFNLPELGNTPFTLVGGRVSYLAQAPGAHLIFSIAKHQISVFIFQDRLDVRFTSAASRTRDLTFNLETWSADGLRYYIISDANGDDIHKLSELLKSAAKS